METNNGVVFYSEDDETNRLQELYSLDILFSEPEKSFDRITEMVSKIFRMPVVLISLITSDRQWFKSCIGLSGQLLSERGSEREASFCQYVIAHKEALIVHDTRLDERFSHNRLVVHEPHIRFYAGAPLRTNTSNILGTLCVIDSEPRVFEQSDMDLLQQFADIVMDEIEYREEIIQRRLAEEQLRFSEERYKNLVELSPDLILVFQNDEFVYANPASTRMFSLPDNSAPYDAEYLNSFLSSEHNDPLLKYLPRYLTRDQPGPLRLEYVLAADNHTDLDMMITITKIKFNAEEAAMVVARDITYQKQAERMVREMNQKLKEISLKDGLTDIPNRRWMDEYLGSAWKRAEQSKSVFSILLIDIDFFKLYNDAYGHLTGDKCLIEVATCIKNSFSRPSDFVARYGGEEFAVFLPDTEQAEALELAEKIRTAVESLNIAHSCSPISDIVTISLGIYSVFPTKQMSALEAFSYADLALYKSKQNGRNCTSVYE
ncbi:sensor domain-containing diguanylate cyclase [Paenibacillus abyssi]|uniref:GGDEF domain-containing protein n=1 Tax=Paenibacillus abyssi TaxID=1340531 RepID=A0A917G3W3_9BACL|nr:diguanylate cyclase [Paenibacillus abyssi]GGG20640.1 hypothetical protein GCM10010916_41690 [Paenibacillus abyssi]